MSEKMDSEQMYDICTNVLHTTLIKHGFDNKEITKILEDFSEAVVKKLRGGVHEERPAPADV